VPAGRTFGKLHDAKVDELTALGIPDKEANIPTMWPMLKEAVKQEGLTTYLQLRAGVRSFSSRGR
jgi:hypothetical protein